MGMHPLVYNVYLLRECQKIWAGSSKVFHRQHACAWINHATAHKALMLQRKTSLKHLIQGLNAGGFKQLSLGSTFGTCQLFTFWQLKPLIKLHYVQVVYCSLLFYNVIFWNHWNISCTLLPYVLYYI